MYPNTKYTTRRSVFMANDGSQKGFLYERNTYKALMDYGIAAGDLPAGAASDRPDLEIKKSKDRSGSKSTGCELKLAPTAAGSLVMKYYKDKWSFGETDGDPEKELMKFVGTKFNILRDHMNTKRTKWGKNTPMLQNDPTNTKIKIVGKKRFSDYPVDQKRKFYNYDLSNYGGQNEVKVIVPASYICDYYISKKCSYLNVGTHGFYTLNKKDDLSLNTFLRAKSKPLIPNFADSVTAEIRVRCQLKSSSKADYQFVMTLQFKGAKGSPYNLAPLVSKESATISSKKLTDNKNMSLLEAFMS